MRCWASLPLGLRTAVPPGRYWINSVGLSSSTTVLRANFTTTSSRFLSLLEMKMRVPSRSASCGIGLIPQCSQLYAVHVFTTPPCHPDFTLLGYFFGGWGGGFLNQMRRRGFLLAKLTALHLSNLGIVGGQTKKKKTEIMLAKRPKGWAMTRSCQEDYFRPLTSEPSTAPFVMTAWDSFVPVKFIFRSPRAVERHGPLRNQHEGTTTHPPPTHFPHKKTRKMTFLLTSSRGFPNQPPRG